MIDWLLQYNTVIIQSLIVLMAAAAFKVKRHRYTALIFAVLTLSHSVFLSGYQDGRHFISAALIDLGIIVWTANLVRVSKLVKDLHKICLIFIGINLAAWAAIKTGTDSTIYLITYKTLSPCYMALYAYSIVLFLTNRDDGTKRYSLDKWAAPLRMIKNTGGL